MDLFVALKKYDTLGKEVSFYAKAGYQKGTITPKKYLKMKLFLLKLRFYQAVLWVVCLGFRK